ncbi:MAG: amidohydrolase family protein [Lautropia sp.]
MLLIHGAARIACFDAARRELRDASLLVADNRVALLADGRDAAALAAIDDVIATHVPRATLERIDARGHVVLPGLVNTHHHLFQTLTRALPAAQDSDLFGWLRALYPVWGHYDPPAFVTAARTGIGELLLSGCTTTSDHQYLFPPGVRLDDTIAAARALGIRFHACRGAMSVGESAGGLPPDALTEREGDVLEDMARVVAAHHDPRPYAMTRVALAPCSPFSVSRELMTRTAELARALGVGLHTHLAENRHDVDYSRERFGQTPAEYAESLGWLGPDVWHAHCVKLDDAGARRFAQTGTGIAHCPCSNMRLASGIAPVARWLGAGIRVGLGVDGSASNDSGDLLAEARQAMLLARVRAATQDAPADARAPGPGAGDPDPRAPGAPALMGAREALSLATRGGAAVLGRDDIGGLAPGMAADIALFDLRGLRTSGSAADEDPLAAIVFCAPSRAAWTIVDGRIVVAHGRLVSEDEDALANEQAAAWRRVRSRVGAGLSG